MKHILLLALALVLGCAAPRPAPEPLAERSPGQIVRQFLEQVYNERKGMEVIDSLFAPGYVAHDPQRPGGRVRGRDPLKARVEHLLEAFPDYRVEVHSVLSEGDRAVARFTASGTHEGEFQGIPPTGRRMAVTSFVEVRVQDGRIVEAWQLVDALAMVGQLGLTVTPPEDADPGR